MPPQSPPDSKLFVLDSTTMPAVYEKLGLKFLYPENWKLTDSADAEIPHEITLESPEGGAMWSVHLYPDETNSDSLLTETIQTLRETYPEMEVSALESAAALPDGSAATETKSSQGVEALFYCLDFLIRARLQVVSASGRTLLVWYQAEDRDFDKMDLVFQAMTTSLLQSLGQ